MNDAVINEFLKLLSGLPEMEQNRHVAGIIKMLQQERRSKVQKLEAEIQKIKVGMEDLEKMIREG